MFVEITNVPRDYDWGSPGAISRLLGWPPSLGPEAELWLGDHPISPARVVGGPLLTDLLSERLTILFKVIAAGAPLSLQVHPGAEDARRGFDDEDARQIPRDSPERTYKDPHAKHELLLAVDAPFHAIAGFRSVAAITRLFRPFATDPAVARLVTLLDSSGGLRAAFRWVLDTGGLAILPGVLEKRDLLTPTDAATVDALIREHPGDPAVIAALFLEPIELAPGTAIFVPAGTPHAYLAGVGVELMVSSDNVVRAGLTSKRVDIEEVMAVTDFRTASVQHCEPVRTRPGVVTFQPEPPYFSLTRVSRGAARDGLDLDFVSTSIVLCLGGSARTTDGREIHRGQSWLVQDEPQVTLRGDADLLIARAGRS